MSALRRLAARLVWMVPFAALISAACEHNPEESVLPGSITVTPTPVTLATSTNQQFAAVAKDPAGHALSGVAFNWSVAAGGGSINSSGLFTAGTTAGTYANTVVARL